MSPARLYKHLGVALKNIFARVWVVAAVLLYIATAAEVCAQQTTKGREFVVSFLPNIHNYGPASDDSLYIYVVADVPTTGTIQYSNGSVTLSRSFSIPNPAVIYTFALQWTGYELRGFNQSLAFDNVNDNETPIRRSFLITTSADVAVYAMNQASTTSDAAMLYPVPALGKEYVLLSYKADGVTDNTGPTLSYTPSEFCVVATQDNTIVNVIPSAPSQVSGLGTKSVVLQRGEAWLCQTAFSTFQLNHDFSGTRVISSAPVAVFSGHQRALIPVEQRGNLQSRDHLFEQMPPTSVWGRSYILTPLAQPPGSSVVTGVNDLYRVVAAEDYTVVRLNNVVIATLNRGQVYEAPLTSPGLITASAKVCVALYKRSHSVGMSLQNGDPFMLIVPPRAQYLKQYRFTNCQATGDYVSQFITVITAQSNASSITLDGRPLNATWKEIPNTCYVYANISSTDGAHTLSSPKLIGLYVYGYGAAISYGYVGGMAFVPDVGDDNVSAGPDRSICIGDTTQISITGKAVRRIWSGVQGGQKPPCDSCDSFSVAPTQNTTYILSAEDSLGCSILDSVTVAVYQLPSVEASPDTVICTDSPFVIRADGSFTDVQWSPPIGVQCPTCAVTTVIPTRDITYTVTAHNGPSARCIATDSIRIRYAKGIANAFPKPVTVCRGDSVRIKIPYSGNVRWSPATSLSCATCTDVVIKPQRSQRYTIVGDSASCSTQATLDIVVADPPVLRAPADTTICAGTPLFVTIQTNASLLGWQPTTYLPGTSLRVLTFTPDSSIRYVLRAESSAGCVTLDTFSVTVLPVPRISTRFADTVVCRGAVVDLSATITGADTIEWTPPTGLSCTDCASPRLIASDTTAYTVRARAKGGCTATAIVRVQTRPSPQISLMADTVRVCKGERAMLAARSSSGSLRWDPSAGVECADCDTTYVIAVESRGIVVSSSNSIGCTTLDTMWLAVLPTPVPVVTVDNDTLCESYGVARIQVQSGLQGGVQGEKYSWQPSDGLSCADCPNPTARPSATTTYTVTIRTADGCSASKQVPIVVVPCARRLRITDVDAGAVVACNTQDTSVEIINEGETDIRIDSVVVLSTDGLVAVVSDSVVRGAIIQPGARVRVALRLIPQRWGSIGVQLGAFANSGMNGADSIHRVNVLLQAQRRDLILSVLPASVTEGGTFELPVSFRSASWNEVPVRAAGLRLRYDRSWMSFTDTASLGTERSNAGWTLRAGSQIADGNDALVQFELKGGTPLQSNEIVLRPRFRVLLSSVASFRPRIDSAWFFEQEVCLRPVFEDAEVLPFGCVRELRRVDVSNTTFALRGVRPLPVHGDEFTVEYSVAFATSVHIELYDAYGKSLTLLQQADHPSGNFSLRVDARQLAAGLYQCVYTAAGVVSAMPVVVIR